MKPKGSKEKLKPISLYGLATRQVIRAFMQVKPKRRSELKEQDRQESVKEKWGLLDSESD